jgi:hypothetical protein
LYAIVAVVKVMLLLLVTHHHSLLRTQILVYKQFFQGSDDIRGWK